MDIYERINVNREKIESAYDLASICYDYLQEQIDNQALFLSAYVSQSERSEQNNPNIQSLNRFSYCVSRLFLQRDILYSLDEVINRILLGIMIMKNGLNSFGDRDAYNEAAIAYFLMRGVDLYAENSETKSSSAPLNEGYRERTFIYCMHSRGMIMAAAEKLEFRNKVQCTEIRNDFKCLRILEKTELRRGMNPPKMVTMYIEGADSKRESIIKSQKLKIAIIPFGKEKIFTFKRLEGISFGVKYTEELKEFAKKKATDLLEVAIRQKANIIVFPEYICFPEMQEAIRIYLQNREPKQIEDLFLVIAGSGWTKDNNNVSRIYSYSGRLLGEQYKSEPYDGLDEGDNEKKNKRRWIEGIQNPGRRSTIVEIPGIGSIMTAICRDVTNSSLTHKLAYFFNIDFIMTVAWSKSLLGGFKRQLADIAGKNTTTSSLVCNACGVFGGSEEYDKYERGIVVTPFMGERIVTEQVDLIKSTAEVCANCTECIFEVIFSYAVRDVQEGKIVKEINQVCVS